MVGSEASPEFRGINKRGFIMLTEPADPEVRKGSVGSLSLSLFLDG